MDKIETGEANMDAKMLDGREVVAELVREARADAAEDRSSDRRLQRLYTWNHHKGNHHKGACPLCGGFCFERGAGR